MVFLSQFWSLGRTRAKIAWLARCAERNARSPPLCEVRAHHTFLPRVREDLLWRISHVRRVAWARAFITRRCVFHQFQAGFAANPAVRDVAEDLLDEAVDLGRPPVAPLVLEDGGVGFGAAALAGHVDAGRVEGAGRDRHALRADGLADGQAALGVTG